MRISTIMFRRIALVCCLLAVVFHPAVAGADWLQQLEADIADWFPTSGIPGMSIVIVQNDVPIYVKGYGQLSVNSTSPVDGDSVFMIGSTSKAFCSAQIAVLVDQKKLNWTDQVRKYLPSFKMYDPWVNAQFQVQDLLCHRSGLHMYSLTMMEVLDYPTDARIPGIQYQQPFTSFRTAFAYQNVMYTSAAKLVEARTKQDWGENLTKSIFQPLKMTRSVTTQAAVDQMKNVAVGHLRLDNGTLWPIPSDWFWNDTQDQALAAAAVRTTANDMAQWLRFNLSQGRIGGQQVVSETNMRLLHAPIVLEAPNQPTPYPPDSPFGGSVAYCYGAWQYWGLSPQPFLYHDGGAMGSGSAIGFAPGANIGIAVLTNLAGGDALAGEIVWDFYNLYFNLNVSLAQLKQHALKARKVFGQPQATAAPASAAQAPGVPLANYCGVYYNPAYGNFVVSQSGNNLMITMGPKAFQAKLAPSDSSGNNFLATMPDYPDGYDFTIPVAFELSASPPTLTTGPIINGLDPKEVFIRTKK